MASLAQQMVEAGAEKAKARLATVKAKVDSTVKARDQKSLGMSHDEWLAQPAETRRAVVARALKDNSTIPEAMAALAPKATAETPPSSDKK